MAERRSTKGRVKIDMKKIQDINARQVTFSKRRSGLFKKASELQSLCGADFAILVSSPSGTVFSFGHPSVETVMDKLLNTGTPHVRPNVPSNFDAYRQANVEEHTRRYTELVAQLEDEEKKSKELQASIGANNGDFWWEDPLDTLDLEDLQHLKFAMSYMKEGITKKIDRSKDLAWLSTQSKRWIGSLGSNRQP